MRYQIRKILKVMTLFEVLCKTSQKRLLKRLLLYPILKFVHRNVVFCDNVHIYSGIFRETIGYRNRSHFFLMWLLEILLQLRIWRCWVPCVLEIPLYIHAKQQMHKFVGNMHLWPVVNFIACACGLIIFIQFH